jgi:hypothetical protein
MGAAWSNMGGGELDGGALDGGLLLDEILRSIRIEAALKSAKETPSIVLTPLQSAYLANK